MATAVQWLEGARPRTLFIAVAPIVAGVGVAAAADRVSWPRAALALLVSLALQVGVNYANDYSDGIRGTDRDRVGPLRLVGSGAAAPRQVRVAAFGCFALAGAAGLVLAALSSWWLIAVGAGCVGAAWSYTGGAHPYGYHALGEAAVFVFFGLVATTGTAYVQTGQLGVLPLLAAIPIGLLACALLVANNLRDIPGDTASGKTTLAVVVGAAVSRRLYLALGGLAFALGALTCLPSGSAWPLLSFAALPLLGLAARPVAAGAVGPALIPTLRATGQLTLGYALALAAGLALSR